MALDKASVINAFAGLSFGNELGLGSWLASKNAHPNKGC